MRGPDPVEALGGLEHGLRTAGSDVLDHGAHGLCGRSDVQLRTGQGGGELGGSEAAGAQIGDGQEGVGVGHGVSLGAPARTGPWRPRRRGTRVRGPVPTRG